MLHIVLWAGISLLAILFRLVKVLRLSGPLLYALLVPTLFRQWYLAHTLLADGILFALLILAVVSWVVSLAKWIRAIISYKRENSDAINQIRCLGRLAREQCADYIDIVLKN